MSCSSDQSWSPSSSSSPSSSFSSSSSSSWSANNFVVTMVCPGEYIIQDKPMANEPVPVRRENPLRANTQLSFSHVNLQKVDPKAISAFLDQCNKLRSHKKLVDKLDESLFFDLFVAAAQLRIKGLLDVLYLIAPYVIRTATFDDVKDILDVIVYQSDRIHQQQIRKRLESLQSCFRSC